MERGMERSSKPNPGGRFHGRVALVTGAGSGMGRAGALRLAREGATVVISGRRPDPLHAVVAEIEGAGGRALAVPTDIGNPSEVSLLHARIDQSFGRLDLVWNNAGVLGDFAPVAEATMANFDALVATNFRGTYLCLQAQLTRMRARGGGAIVLTSSWTGHGAMPGIAAYAATKAALDALTRTISAEEGQHGIRINAVSPGIIATPMLEAAMGSEANARPFGRHAPLRRVGSSEDVADAVTWLLSDDARFVTGQSLLVDGGYTLGGLRPWMVEA